MPDFFKKKFTIQNASERCPACGAGVDEVNYQYVDDDQQANFYKCAKCTFLFVRPVLLPSLEERQMDDVIHAEMFNSSLLKRLYVTLFIDREIRKLKRYRKSSASSLLDIGCGTGWTSKVYVDNGFDVTGLEPAKERAQLARDLYDIDVVDGYVENLELDKKYDLAILRHILEHFADPEESLVTVGEQLHDDGLLLVVLPNINCLGRYMFETHWNWVLPWHCNFFTPKSIKTFVEKCGFEVLECYQTPSPLYFFESFLRKYPSETLRKIVEKNKVFSILLSAPFAVLGTFLGMGDNLNVIARKK